MAAPSQFAVPVFKYEGALIAYEERAGSLSSLWVVEVLYSRFTMEILVHDREPLSRLMTVIYYDSHWSLRIFTVLQSPLQLAFP